MSTLQTQLSTGSRFSGASASPRKTISTVLRFSLDEKNRPNSPDYSDEQEHWNTSNSSHSNSSTSSSSGIQSASHHHIMSENSCPIFHPMTQALNNANSVSPTFRSTISVDPAALSSADDSSDSFSRAQQMDSSCLPATGWNYFKRPEVSANTPRRRQLTLNVAIQRLAVNFAPYL